MTASKSCSIKLLNKSYEIKCPETEIDNLQLAAEKLNEYLLQNKKKYRQLDDFQILLLAALHISHELICAGKEHLLQRQQMNQFISSLENKIQQAACGNLTQAIQTEHF